MGLCRRLKKKWTNIQTIFFSLCLLLQQTGGGLGSNNNICWCCCFHHPASSMCECQLTGTVFKYSVTLSCHLFSLDCLKKNTPKLHPENSALCCPLGHVFFFVSPHHLFVWVWQPISQRKGKEEEETLLLCMSCTTVQHPDGLRWVFCDKVSMQDVKANALRVTTCAKTLLYCSCFLGMCQCRNKHHHIQVLNHSRTIVC